MLHTWDQRILSRVIIFIGLQVIFVQCFFDRAHISIHFELIFNLKLLIQHVSIFLLIFSPLFFLESLHLVGMVCLHPSLVLIKILRVIHLFDMILLILLHLKLLVIQMASLCFLSLNKFFFIIISLSDVIKIIYFFLFILQHFIILSLCNSFSIQILMFSLSILCFLLFSPLYIIVSSYTTQSFVFISLPFDTSFVIVYGPFQFCRLIQLL